MGVHVAIGSTQSGKGVCFFMFKNDKWNLHLFFNGKRIKRLKIDKNEAPANNVYVVKVIGKKDLFGSFISTIAVRPVRLIHNDENKKATYWGVIYELGVEVK